MLLSSKPSELTSWRGGAGRGRHGSAAGRAGAGAARDDNDRAAVVVRRLVAKVVRGVQSNKDSGNDEQQDLCMVSAHTPDNTLTMQNVKP